MVDGLEVRQTERYLNKERVTLSGANVAATIPTGARWALIMAEGNAVRYEPNGTATATSPGYVAVGTVLKLSLVGMTSLGLFGVATTYANIVYFE